MSESAPHDVQTLVTKLRKLRERAQADQQWDATEAFITALMDATPILFDTAERYARVMCWLSDGESLDAQEFGAGAQGYMWRILAPVELAEFVDDPPPCPHKQELAHTKAVLDDATDEVAARAILAIISHITRSHDKLLELVHAGEHWAAFITDDLGEGSVSAGRGPTPLQALRDLHGQLGGSDITSKADKLDPRAELHQLKTKLLGLALSAERMEQEAVSEIDNYGPRAPVVMARDLARAVLSLIGGADDA